MTVTVSVASKPHYKAQWKAITWENNEVVDIAAWKSTTAGKLKISLNADFLGGGVIKR